MHIWWSQQTCSPIVPQSSRIHATSYPLTTYKRNGQKFGLCHDIKPASPAILVLKSVHALTQDCPESLTAFLDPCCQYLHCHHLFKFISHHLVNKTCTTSANNRKSCLLSQWEHIMPSKGAHLSGATHSAHQTTTTCDCFLSSHAVS